MTLVAKTFDRIEVVSLPLKSKFRGLESRELMLVKGNRWAEFSPFIEYPDAESQSWLQATLEWANGDLPKIKRSRVPINATLPAVEANEVERALSAFGNVRTIKIKVAEPGQSSDIDLARIQKVIQLYPDVKIRLDANGKWSVAEAIAFARSLADLHGQIEYLEQPVSTIDQLVELREKFHNLELNIPIAADESIRKASDPLEVIRRQAADILVLKAAPLGGIWKSLEIAKTSNLGIVISSAIESSVGLQSGLHLAAALEESPLDCGLGTSALFIEDVVDEPLLPSNGFIDLREVEPSEELIRKYSVAEDRKEFWIQRLERVMRLL